MELISNSELIELHLQYAKMAIKFSVSKSLSSNQRRTQSPTARIKYTTAVITSYLMLAQTTAMRIDEQPAPFSVESERRHIS